MHIAATLIGGAALAVGAYHDTTGMDTMLAAYAAWVLWWVTNATRNVKIDDKKVVEKRIPEGEVVLREVSGLITKIGRLLKGPLVLAILERAEVSGL